MTRKNLDQESRALIYEGASANQLADIFGMKPADVLRKLAGLEAAGYGRQSNPIWRIRDAAPRLVRIDITAEMIDTYMKRANPKDLPPATNKMFWDGMMQAIRYKERSGELWHTADVSELAGTVFQSLRMSLLLLPDLLFNETGLTDRQLEIAQTVIDNALEEARAALVVELRKPSEQPRSVESDGEDGEL